MSDKTYSIKNINFTFNKTLQIILNIKMSKIFVEMSERERTLTSHCSKTTSNVVGHYASTAIHQFANFGF